MMYGTVLYVASPPQMPPLTTGDVGILPTSFGQSAGCMLSPAMVVAVPSWQAPVWMQ